MLKVCTDQITEIVAPVLEPLTLAEAKTHLKVDITDSDAEISEWITAARRYVEIYCGRSFAAHTYRADLSGFSDQILLPYRPIQSITSVKYYNTDSPTVLTTLSANVYTLFISSVVRNHGQTWESVYPRNDAVQITFVTGYDADSSPLSTANVPQDIKSVIKMLLTAMHEDRSSQFSNAFSTVQENKVFQMLMHPYRVYL